MVFRKLRRFSTRAFYAVPATLLFAVLYNTHYNYSPLIFCVPPGWAIIYYLHLLLHKLLIWNIRSGNYLSGTHFFEALGSSRRGMMKDMLTGLAVVRTMYMFDVCCGVVIVVALLLKKPQSP
jgi:hypothetical protein